MAFFPLFIELQKKQCLVVGGGTVATRKIKRLLDYTDHIKVISPVVSTEITTWAAAGRLITSLREFQASDCEGAFLVIAATSSAPVNKSIYQAASARGSFVNVADAPELCTFFSRPLSNSRIWL